MHRHGVFSQDKALLRLHIELRYIYVCKVVLNTSVVLAHCQYRIVVDKFKLIQSILTLENFKLLFMSVGHYACLFSLWLLEHWLIYRVWHLHLNLTDLIWPIFFGRHLKVAILFGVQRVTQSLGDIFWIIVYYPVYLGDFGYFAIFKAEAVGIKNFKLARVFNSLYIDYLVRVVIRGKS